MTAAVFDWALVCPDDFTRIVPADVSVSSRVYAEDAAMRARFKLQGERA